MGVRYVLAVITLNLAIMPAVLAQNDPGKSINMNPVNVAEFGTPWTMPGNATNLLYAPKIADGRKDTVVEIAPGGVLQIEWRQPRDIHQIAVTGPLLPAPEDIQVQWWHSRWPDNGSGGWQTVDDPYRGNWVTVKAAAEPGTGIITFRFAALDNDELDAKRPGEDYRRTYKIKVIFNAPAVVSELETRNTSSTWKTAQLKLEWAPKAKKPDLWKGKIEARNARLVSVIPAADPGDPVLVKVEYVDNSDRLSADRGFVVFRSAGWKSFSVFVDDVVREGGLYVRDIDAFVSDASKKLSYSTWAGPSDRWEGTIMELVDKLPEQSLEQVGKAIPLKPRREAHLGLPNMRQEFTINPSGNIQLEQESLRSPGKDLDSRVWDSSVFCYAVSTDEKPEFTENGGRNVERSLEEGYLPVIHTEWKSGDIQYKQAAFVSTLVDPLAGIEDSGKGDETLVCLDKVDITNAGSSEQTAYLWLEMTKKTPMQVRTDGLFALDAPSDGKGRPGLTPTRGVFKTHGKGELAYLTDVVPTRAGSPDDSFKDSLDPRPAVRYTVKLTPGETHTVYLNVPYIELLNDAELSALVGMTYDDQHAEIVDYWKKRINAGMKYEVPEPTLNNLWKANLWHVLMTTDRDPFTGLYEHGAATMHYMIYANETGMVARSLEMRGERQEAFRLEEPFLKCQSLKPLPGNFMSKDGLMYAAHPDPKNDPYTAQGYNMHHGWALWNLSEHYKWTRDKAYLKSIAPNLIAACDWITRERKATKVMNPDGSKPVEWALAPAGDLEDVEEYLYWYATNAYYYLGLKTAADTLAEIGHPEAGRLRKDAEAYRSDILASVQESVATSPVVKLKDGTYIPFVPPRAYALTHQKEGWIREGLYSAIHLLDGEVLPPNHPYVTWILQDLEDNIFLSSESGYGVKDQKADFFNFGGFNLQPNLCPNTTAYLRRDEIPQFLRVFYNECWASLNPDIVCFAEWVPSYGRSSGPLYKTPDESKFVQYMRNMLVFEESDTLKLGFGIPRAWLTDGKVVSIEKAATWFGPMGLKITSHAASGTISAVVTPPSRNPAKTVGLRLRHPDGKRITKVTINGKVWRNFSAEKETISLPTDVKAIEVVAYY